MSYTSIPTQRRNIESRVVRRAWADASYRARLIDDPRAALEDELGIDLPAGLEVMVVEERPDMLCVVLPVDISGISEEAARVMLGVAPEVAQAEPQPDPGGRGQP